MIYLQYNCHDLPHYNESNTIVTEFNIIFAYERLWLLLTGI